MAMSRSLPLVISVSKFEVPRFRSLRQWHETVSGVVLSATMLVTHESSSSIRSSHGLKSQTEVGVLFF
ncbi:hypothetical protein CUMW_203650 [Citrus unshiu]|uniref:Uncharacterized protein n=1 Tax=Citrus unshiu TaxID=55188 RepID=A0A2H5Q8Q3_CITUN|nr:hypothetical protein CUMW_203650 [Citrus unshiu]